MVLPSVTVVKPVVIGTGVHLSSSHEVMVMVVLDNLETVDSSVHEEEVVGNGQ